MHRDRLDVILIVLVTALQIGLTLAPGSGGPLRVACGLIFALFAPGYALAAAGWPARRPHWPERLVLSLGLSLAIEALGGLLLNLTGPGLRPETWTALLVPITLGGCVVSLLRRAPDARWLEWRRPAATTLVASLGAAVVVLAAFGVASAGAITADQEQGFSQMWILSDDPASGSVRVGLRSLELQPATYRIQVLADTGLALDVPDVQLGPGQSWEATVSLPPADSGSGTINAVAYRGSYDVPYRRVRLVTHQPQG